MANTMLPISFHFGKRIISELIDAGGERLPLPAACIEKGS
jgi:hypothetical protein